MPDTDFVLLELDNPTELAHEVKMLLADGWKLHGQTFATVLRMRSHSDDQESATLDREYFYQAMVR